MGKHRNARMRQTECVISDRGEGDGKSHANMWNKDRYSSDSIRDPEQLWVTTLITICHLLLLLDHRPWPKYLAVGIAFSSIES